MMIERNLEIKMPVNGHFSRLDTLELKNEIVRKIGRPKAAKYFYFLNRFLSFKLSKSDLIKICIGTIGKENIALHNRLLRASLKNADHSETPPSKESKTNDSLNSKVSNGCQRSSLQSLCRDVFPQSPRKGRTPILRDRKFRDRPSPLGPHGKIHNFGEESVPKIQEQQSATELVSLGSRPPAEANSVEDGEEVEQAAGSASIRSRSPVRAPLGISINMKGPKKLLCNGSASALYTETCQNVGELPDTSTLRNRLEKKLEMEGFEASEDFVNLLNNGVDVFLKRLIKPCLELASSRFGHKHPSQGRGPAVSGLNGTYRYGNKPSGSVPASILDFRVAMELNPQILGENWPIHMEKICLHASEE